MHKLTRLEHPPKGGLPRFIMKLTLVSLTIIAACAFTPAATAKTTGAAFAMTNRAAKNQVVAFNRAADGTLTEVGGNGIGVDFDTQGGLTLSADDRYLYA